MGALMIRGLLFGVSQGQPKLHYMLQKMTFQTLIGLAFKSECSSEVFVEDLAGALARMRPRMRAASSSSPTAGSG